MNQIQKGPATNSVVPVYSFPPNHVQGPAFRARPLKIWRKQLIPTQPSNNRIIGMPMDLPGGSVYLGNTSNNVNSCVSSPALDNVGTIKEDLPAAVCCDPTVKNRPFIYRSASTVINKNYYTDHRAYLYSRSQTYNQKLVANPVPGVNYFAPDGSPLYPTNAADGPQVRLSPNCGLLCQNGTQLNNQPNIYKRSNTTFATQGAVDSSSRIDLLKLNMLNLNNKKGNRKVNVLKLNNKEGNRKLNKYQ